RRRLERALQCELRADRAPAGDAAPAGGLRRPLRLLARRPGGAAVEALPPARPAAAERWPCLPALVDLRRLPLARPVGPPDRALHRRLALPVHRQGRAAPQYRLCRLCAAALRDARDRHPPRRRHGLWRWAQSRRFAL